MLEAITIVVSAITFFTATIWMESRGWFEKAGFAKTVGLFSLPLVAGLASASLAFWALM